MFLAYILIVMGAFIVLAIFSSANPYFPIDLQITLALQAYTGGWFGALMQAVSWFGYMPQAAFLVVAVGLGIYFTGYAWEAIMSVLSAGGVELLNFIVKYLVRQPRPSPSLVHVARVLTSFSFPSGHVMFYTGFFGFLIFLCFALLKSSWWRTLLLVILIVLVALVGLSRIYLGEHWSSDVLAGYLLASIFLLGMVLIYRNFKPRFFTHEDKDE